MFTMSKILTLETEIARKQNALDAANARADEGNRIFPGVSPTPEQVTIRGELAQLTQDFLVEAYVSGASIAGISGFDATEGGGRVEFDYNGGRWMVECEVDRSSCGGWATESTSLWRYIQGVDDGLLLAYRPVEVLRYTRWLEDDMVHVDYRA